MGQIAVTHKKKLRPGIPRSLPSSRGMLKLNEIEMVTLVTEPLLSIKSPDQTALEA